MAKQIKALVSKVDMGSKLLTYQLSESKVEFDSGGKIHIFNSENINHTIGLRYKYVFFDEWSKYKNLNGIYESFRKSLSAKGKICGLTTY